MSGIILDKGIYGFMNWDTLKVIDLFAGDNTSGTQVITYHAHFDYFNNQLWRAQAVADGTHSGYFYLLNIEATSAKTNIALALQAGTGSSPAVLVGSTYVAGATTQMWKFVSLAKPGETPSYVIQNASSPVCVTIPNGTSQDSTQLQGVAQGDVPIGYQRYVVVPVTPAGWTATPPSS